MAFVKAKDISTEYNFIQPNWNQGGIVHAYAETVDYDKASAYVDPLLLEAQQMGGSRLAMAMIVPGGVYEFGGGTVSAPGIRWAADTDTGFYWISAGVFGVSIDGTNEVTFNSSGIRIADMTQNSVLFAGASGQISQDNTNFSFTDSTDTLKVGGGIRVGTATDTATAGDFVAGLTGASRVFFDQTLQTLSVYDSSGNEDLSLDVAADSWYNGAGNFGIGTTSPGRKLDVSLLGSPQLRLNATGGYYVDLQCDSNADLYIQNAAGLGQQIILEGSQAATDYRIRVNNTNTTSGTAGAVFYLQVGGTSGGDPYSVYDITGGSTWIMGADNSDSDKFKLTTSALSGFSGTKGIFVTSGIYTNFAPAVASSGTAYAVDLSGAINTGGTNGLFRITNAASTGQTASTEINFINFDLGATTTWATGAITSQRAIFIEAPTLAFASASTVTNAATVYIDRAPQAGTNATITNPYALWIGGGKHILADGTNTVASAAGAIWNAVLLDMDVSVSGSTNITTATGFNMVALNAPTITDVGTMGTITNSATLYIGGAPTGSGLTITNAYALWVDDGAVRFDGAVTAASFTVSGLTSGRVTFATTGGALTDDAGFTFDGVTLTLSDSNAATTPLAILNQDSTGDSALRFSLSTTRSYAVGIDNSASDSFIISTAASGTAVLGTGNLLTLTTAGALTVDTATVSTSLRASGVFSVGDAPDSTFARAAVWGAFTAADGGGAFYGLYVDPDFTEGGIGGTHAIIASLGVVGNPITNGAATTDLAATVYLVGVPTGATDNYLLYGSITNALTYPIANFVQTSTGDAAIRLALGTTASFIFGIDNSDSDSFKLSYAASGAAALGTSDYFTISTTGGATVAQWLNVGASALATAANDFAAGASASNFIFWDDSLGFFQVAGTGSRQVRLAYTAGAVYTDIQTDSGGICNITSTGKQLVFFGTNAGSYILFDVQNSDNTNANSNARFRALVGGSSAGDAYVHLVVIGVTDWSMGIDNSDSDKFKISANAGPGASDFLVITTTGNISAGVASLSTTATDGFLYVPTCGGPPTGAPTGMAGFIPIVVDSTNHKLYFYSGGSWRDAGP